MADVGPLLAVVGYLVFPLVWSVPEGLLTAELASAFPENAGAVAWVSTAFGDFPGYLRGSLSWMSGVIDNAIYVSQTQTAPPWPCPTSTGGLRQPAC